MALLCVVLLSATVPGIADVITMKDNTVLKDRWISAIQAADGVPANVITNRVRGGKVGTLVEMNPLADILTIEFREPGDTATPPMGRVTHVRARDNRKIFNYVVESGKQVPGNFLFTMRDSLEPPGGPTFESSILQLAEMQLAPAPALMQPGTAGGATAGGGGPPGSEESYLDEPAAASPGGYVPPEVIETPEGPTGPLTPEEMLDQLTRNNGQPGTPGQPQTPFVIPPMPKTNPFSLEGQGFYLAAAMVAGIMGITFIFGSFVIKFAAKQNDIKDLTTTRALACAFLLSVVPPSLFLLCFFLIPIFIGIKLFAGVLSFYFSARTIVMAFMEVLEGKAFDILLSFYSVLLLIVALLWAFRDSIPTG